VAEQSIAELRVIFEAKELKEAQTTAAWSCWLWASRWLVESSLLCLRELIAFVISSSRMVLLCSEMLLSSC
jgi:hypothetical protein